MSADSANEVLLRPAVELYSVAIAFASAMLCLFAPWAIALSWQIGLVTACGFLLFGAMRLRDAYVVLRYRRNIRRLPRYEITSSQIPVSQHRLFLGRGFKWQQKHTHRLMQTYRPQFRRFVEQPYPYQLARKIEEKLEFAPPIISWVAKITAKDSIFNPVRPLPPVGGMPRLHGIEPIETDVSLPLSERVGHTLVLGTTRVGKTRLAELLVTQDIRRGEVCIFFDPKGDADMLIRMYIEAKRAGREEAFYVFQQLNRWPTDGEVDYQRNIHSLSAYFTPSCQTYLEADYRIRRDNGELRKRIRGVYEIPGRGYADDPTKRVQQISNDEWLVTFDIAADEYFGSEQVKRALVRYPVRVIKMDVDPEKNPFGLALDCYDTTPQRIEVSASEKTNNALGNKP